MNTATKPDTDVLQQIREQAGQRFEQLGWPTPRLEEWKYTNLQALQSRFDAGTFREAATPAASRSSAPLPLRFGDRALGELVFVNGVFSPEASSLPSVAGLRVTTFRNASVDVLEEHFARYADYEQHALVALNTANAQDGAVIEADAAIEGFVHVLFVGSDGFQSFPRNLIVAGRGSQLAVVESYAGTGAYFTNSVTEIVAEDGAVVDHYRLECESLEAFHVGTVQIHQGRSSSVSSRSFAVGGAVARNDTNAVLAAEGANLVLEGLFVTNGTQHIDNHTLIDHAVPHCESVELYKGILDGSSRGIFDGKIMVREGAQKTVSRQTNKNLLLSETAVVDSKPTLEIFNDDVKCNHGSTIGQLEEEPLFYLRSRGIGQEEARNLLVYAFASELVDRIRIDAVREQIGRAMFQQMPGRLPDRRGEQR
jgi:Fe-S cluster assembly protein SufD